LPPFSNPSSPSSCRSSIPQWKVRCRGSPTVSPSPV
jgi:hypothetical protein